MFLERGKLSLHSEEQAELYYPLVSIQNDRILQRTHLYIIHSDSRSYSRTLSKLLVLGGFIELISLFF